MIIEDGPAPIKPEAGLVQPVVLNLSLHSFHFLLHRCILSSFSQLVLDVLLVLGRDWQVPEVFAPVVGHFLLEDGSSFLILLENKLGCGYLDAQLFGGLDDRNSLLDDATDQFRTFLCGMYDTSGDILEYFL